MIEFLKKCLMDRRRLSAHVIFVVWTNLFHWSFWERIARNFSPVWWCFRRDLYAGNACERGYLAFARTNTRSHAEVEGSALHDARSRMCLCPAGACTECPCPDVRALPFAPFGQGMTTEIAFTEIGRWFVANRGRAMALITPGQQLGSAILPAIVVLIVGATGNWRMGCISQQQQFYLSECPPSSP
jgi:hypothetical protein